MAGTVGTAAAIAIANAVHATGIRVRDLPIRPEALLAGGDERGRDEDPALSDPARPTETERPGAPCESKIRMDAAMSR